MYYCLNLFIQDLEYTCGIAASILIFQIEKENEEKVESLEKKLVLEKKNESYQSEKTKEAEDQQFLAWENFENKMQTNVQLMLDKAQYWEKVIDIYLAL